MLGLAVLGTLELLPNFPSLVRTYRAQNGYVATLTASVGHELREVTRPGDIAFFLNLSQDDYLVNYLARYAGLRTYNAGGDKNVYLAVHRWPPQISALATPPTTPKAVETALADRQASVIAVRPPHASSRGPRGSRTRAGAAQLPGDPQ